MNRKYENSLYLGTYRAVFSGLVAPAGVAPFLVINGSSSATKQVFVSRITVSGPTLTAVAYLNLVLSRYSTANTGGTSTNATAVPSSTSMPAATATIAGYTVAPTAGTLVGDTGAHRMLGQATTAAASGLTSVCDLIFDVESRPTLSSSAQNLALRFSSAPASAVTLSVAVEWDEYGY